MSVPLPLGCITILFIELCTDIVSAQPRAPPALGAVRAVRQGPQVGTGRQVPDRTTDMDAQMDPQLGRDLQTQMRDRKSVV